ncbi:MAG: hypothetical protein JKY48_08170, partial [Flavobacteriales bacterium]|nr:hypothetical protein [Flavobacteriales bacterium]
MKIFATSLLILFSLLFSPALFAAEESDGLSCETAFSMKIGDSSNHTFPEGQDRMYVEFTASNDSIEVQFSDNGQGPFADISKLELYSSEGCEELLLFGTYYAPESSSEKTFHVTDLQLNGSYLIIIYRELAEQSEFYKLKLSNHKRLKPCPVDVPICASNIVKNGDFEYYQLYDANHMINRGWMCDWKNLFPNDFPHLIPSLSGGNHVSLYSIKPSAVPYNN